MAEKKQRQAKAYKAGKYCPKCGPGFRLAAHEKRLACGKCGYMETVTA